MMNLVEILRGIFNGPPPITTEKTKENIKDESELRWEKALANARMRRARELQIDVDLERGK